MTSLQDVARFLEYGSVPVFAVLLLCGCGTHQPAPSVTHVRIAVPTSPTINLPIYLASELGYFREHGLDVEIEDMPGGAKALQAMFGGSVDLCATAYEFTIQLNSEGRHVRSFLSILDRPG